MIVRRLINTITRLCGWKPIGKRIRFISGEGPEAAQLAGQSGIIIHLDRRGPVGTETMTVRIDSAETVGRHPCDVLLIARHAGYGAYALATTCIACYVLSAEDGRGTTFPDKSKMIALMDVCVC